MSRRKRDFTREILPDPKYGDVVITKLINVLTRDGKRGVAEKALYSALEVVEKKLSTNPVEAFHTALNNIKPTVEVRSRRVGGANYQVPTEVRSARALSLGIRWLVQGANSRSERNVRDRLANELIDALNNRGIAVKKREDTHRMAEANKAFAHFKW